MFYKEAVNYEDRWNLCMGSQSSRTWDIHGYGYRIRQMPYTSSKHPENSGAGVSRKEHDDGAGRREVTSSSYLPSLVCSCQDRIPPLTGTHIQPLNTGYSFPMFTFVIFLSDIPQPQSHPYFPLTPSIYTELFMFTKFQITAFIIIFK